MEPTFFDSPAALRKWFAKHAATALELHVGYYKRDSGQASITWPESVDEALCVGWIDGIRRRIDDASYMIRFTPRKATSIWSAVNIRRAHALIEARRMRAAGLRAFEQRREDRSRRYAYEQAGAELTGDHARQMRANKRAAAFFHAQPPWYQRTAGWWVTSAKQEATRQRRLAQLIEDSANGVAIRSLRRKPE